MSEASQLEALIADLKSPNSGIRRSAVAKLADHPERQHAVSALTDALGDHIDYVVTTACDALAKIGGSHAHDALLRLLSHRDAYIRERMLSVFGPLWRDSDFAPILECSQHDENPKVRKESAWLLHEKAAQGHGRELFALWLRDTLPRHKVWACEIAAEIGDPTLRDQLLPLTLELDGHVRTAAVRALRRLQPGA